MAFQGKQNRGPVFGMDFWSVTKVESRGWPRRLKRFPATIIRRGGFLLLGAGRGGAAGGPVVLGTSRFDLLEKGGKGWVKGSVPRYAGRQGRTNGPKRRGGQEFSGGRKLQGGCCRGGPAKEKNPFGSGGARGGKICWAGPERHWGRMARTTVADSRNATQTGGQTGFWGRKFTSEKSLIVTTGIWVGHACGTPRSRNMGGCMRTGTCCFGVWAMRLGERPRGDRARGPPALLPGREWPKIVHL